MKYKTLAIPLIVNLYQRNYVGHLLCDKLASDYFILINKLRHHIKDIINKTNRYTVNT